MGFIKIITAFRHAFDEGRRAAWKAADAESARQLRFDYFWTRLLRLVPLPGYNKVRQVNLCGMKLNYRFNRGDLQSVREVFLEEVYACDLPFAPRTLLDLGANIGLASLWFSQQAKEGRTSELFLLAVEPDLRNASVVEVNFRANFVSGQVVRAAVGQKAGEAWFEARAESNLGRVTSEAFKGTKIRVPVVDIRDLLDRFPEGRVDLVKMDIEGGEEVLLSHDTDWLARVNALIVEWHDDRADSRPLIRNVEAAGFVHRRINEARQENLSLFYRLADSSEGPSDSICLKPNPFS